MTTTYAQKATGRPLISSSGWSAATWSSVSGFQKLAVDLSTITTIPSWATGVVFSCNTNSTGARFGIQSTGDTEFWVSESAVTDRQSSDMLVPINGSKTFDFFVTNTTNCVIYIVGFMSHAQFITPYNASGSITSATTTAIDLGTGDIVPAGAANGWVAVTTDKLCKLAGSSADLASMMKPPSNVSRALAIVPLDAARKFYVQSYATFGGASALRVIAWGENGSYVPASSYSTEDVSPVDSQFHPLSRVINGEFAHYRIGTGTPTTSGSSSALRGMRPSGDTNYTVAIDCDTKTNNAYALVGVSASGLVDAFAAISGIHYEYHGTFVADTSAAYITSLSGFVAGTTATVTFSKSVTSVTRLRVTSTFDSHYIDITSFSGSGTTWTFTVPDISNATDGIRFGAVSISPVTNSGTGADYTSAVYSKTGYASVNIEDVLAGNVCEGDSPALLTNDQIAYDSTTGATVDVHGIYNDPPPIYVGVQTMLHYAADFKWYSFTITTSEPTSSSTFASKLKATKLTATKLTATKITAKKA